VGQLVSPSVVVELSNIRGDLIMKFIETISEGLKFICSLVIFLFGIKFLALFLFSLPGWLSEILVTTLVVYSFGCLSQMIDKISNWLFKI
jgi:hypothetical protein